MQIKDKHGHDLDGDWDPKGHGGCDHQETVEWKAEHAATRKEKPMPAPNHDPVFVGPPAPEPEHEPILVAINDGTPALAAATPTPEAAVGVDAAVSQVKALLPAGMDASPALLIGGAAGLAVVGAAIKFGPQVLKARHEARMKQLEIEQEKQEKQEDNHKECAASREALRVEFTVKVQELEKKLAERSESSGSSFDLGDFDPEELEERLKRLEKALKPAKAPAKKKR